MVGLNELERRRKELEDSNRQLRDDIERCQAFIKSNDEELSKIAEVADYLSQLAGARRTRAEPRVPTPPQATASPQKKQRPDIPGKIRTILAESEVPLRPIEIKHRIEQRWGLDLGQSKHVASECNRLFLSGELKRDEFAPLYSFPPSWADKETPTQENTPNDALSRLEGAPMQ